MGRIYATFALYALELLFLKNDVLQSKIQLEKYRQEALFCLTGIILISLICIDTIIPVLFYFTGTYQEYLLWFPDFHTHMYSLVRVFFPFIFSGLIFYNLLPGTALHIKITLTISVVNFLILLLVPAFYGIVFLFFYFLVLIFILSIYKYREGLKSKFKKFIFFIADKNSSTEKRIQNLFLPLLILLVCFRILLVFFTDNSAEPDGSCRILISQVWAEYYITSESWLWFLNPNPDWPPLHFYISGIILKITSSTTSLRLIHAIAGVVSAIFIYKICKEAVSKTTSLIASTCFLLYPADIFISSQVMSEPIFHLFMFISLYAFIRLKKERTEKYQWINILAVNACCLLRYEGWTIPVFYFLIDIIINRKLNSIQVATLVFSSVSSVLVCIVLYMQGFHPLRGILYSDFQVTYTFSQAGKSFLIFMNGYKAAWIPGAFLLFVISFFVFIKNKTLLIINLFTLLFLLPFIYKNATFTIFPQFRYLTNYEVLFIIPICALVSHIAEKRLGKTFFALTICTLFAFCLTLTGGLFIDFSKLSFPEGYKKSITYVNEKIKEGNFIVDHHGNVGSYNWISETNIPVVLDYDDDYYEQFLDFAAIRNTVDKKSSMKRRIKYLVSDRDSEFNSIDFNLVCSTLSKGKNSYLVLFPNGDLANYFLFSQKRESKNGLNFELLFSDNGYLIYKLI